MPDYGRLLVRSVQPMVTFLPGAILHLISEHTLICKLIWFFDRLTWNPAESLVCDVQLNVLHQAASCFSRYDIRDITIHQLYEYESTCIAISRIS
ncbi:hypothetical protein T265_09954 [Opisthorchis viverrini]|uniref:Uncharacterized protein n=1 Tax=Opisthorchis viverrini TaxID=6198 RepID=A0A075A328_OPIVI|nr:hypothetical protein T265_09954 [Opisthorchis viverrini]KER21794.1 hypothetical protein T265_09954 [Opisthorchis viverrini]